jgi:Flp pilus assembly pilin Flp
MKIKDTEGLPTVEERDLTLVATLVTVIVVAGGVFLVNAASTKYRTASYASPTLNSVPIMAPATSAEPAPKQ